MEKVSKAKRLMRDAIAVTKDPRVLPIMAMYWVMTRHMAKRTEADREQAFALFASRILGTNPDTALSAVEPRCRD